MRSILLVLFALTACTDIDPSGTWHTTWRYVDGDCGLTQATDTDVMLVESTDTGWSATIADTTAAISLDIECGSSECRLTSTRISAGVTTVLDFGLDADDAIVGNGTVQMGCNQNFTATGTRQ
jgi:hypothetical protein